MKKSKPPVAHRKALGSVLKREAVRIALEWDSYAEAFGVEDISSKDVRGMVGKWMEKVPGEYYHQILDERPESPAFIDHRRRTANIIQARAEQIILLWDVWIERADPQLKPLNVEQARELLAHWLQRMPTSKPSKLLYPEE